MKLWPNFGKIRKDQAISLEDSAKKTAAGNPEPDEPTTTPGAGVQLSSAPGKEGPAPVVRAGGSEKPAPAKSS